MKFSKHLIAVATTAALLAPATASATAGYFSLAYGAKSRGIAGAATALSQDTYAAAVNPAGMAKAVGTNDVGILIFSPIREAETGASPTAFGGVGQIRSKSGSDGFIIPSGGFVRQLNDKMTWGMSIYANGGLNTAYEHDVTVPTMAGPTDGNLFGFPNEALGVDLAQLIFAPTITYALNKDHTVGASLLIGYQQFKAYGLQGFCGLKSATFGDNTCAATGGPNSAASNDGLTNQGYDNAWGVGLRVGWQGKLSENVSVGAAYSTKVYMNEFDKYDELFAEDGDFDIPANWSIGISGKVSPKMTLSADIQQILYSDVKSIANDGPGAGLGMSAAPGQQLGFDGGLGFGWEDVTVFKIGAVYEHNDKFTYRFGYAHNTQAFDDDQLAFNVLAPAVIRDHVTAGFTYRPDGKDDQQVTFTFMHAIEASQRGVFPADFGGGSTRLQMYQNAFDFQYSWTY